MPATAEQRHPMQDAHSALPFDADDLQPLAPEEVSHRLRVSYAFTQLCLDCGCPTRSNRVSAAELLHWLFANYARVRATAGLNPLAPVDGLPPDLHRQLSMTNAVHTLLDFGISRATDPLQKRELRKVSQNLEQTLQGR